MGSDKDIDPYDSEYAESDYAEDENYSDFEDYDTAVADDDGPITNSYTVLEEAEIRKRQEDIISHTSVNLRIPEVAASKLLHHYRWNTSKLDDEWFADEEKVRDKVGLPSTTVPFSFTHTTCGICFDLLPLEEFYPMVCGHPYCKTCWRVYITVSINNGPGCLSLRCPEPSCRAAVCQDLINELATEEERNKYSRYFLRSYVEESKTIKWCPLPGCKNAVEHELEEDIYDVTCLCLGTFCWNCGEDAHRPVDCETVAKWVLKNSSESENIKWILVNSKSCPKCRRYIEKDNGCKHMVCSDPCRYEFCWLCLGNWTEHDMKADGYYACNKYEVAKKLGEYQEEERIKEQAKNSLDKYTHYFERWTANQKSREKAIEEWKALDTGTMEKLRNKTGEREIELSCIPGAWKQIIEGRRILQWTFAYAYYLPEDEPVKKIFFEHTQGIAESVLERLHHCVEVELNHLLREDEADFKTFRTKLVGLTTLTATYFSNLVAELER